jgi:hypothetical protein
VGACGNRDHSSAIAPVTKGAAALVPANVIGWLSPKASDPVAGCASSSRITLQTRRARDSLILTAPCPKNSADGHKLIVWISHRFDCLYEPIEWRNGHMILSSERIIEQDDERHKEAD